MAVKRTPADIAFTQCIKASYFHTCNRCHMQHVPNSQGVGVSHHLKRINWSIRLDPLNAELLCTNCHYSVGGTEARRKLILTEDEIQTLYDRNRDQNLARLYKKTEGKGEIAKHYRDQHKIIEGKRNDGVVGIIGFSAWI